MRTIKEALKSHLLREGYVSASHMESCHEQPFSEDLSSWAKGVCSIPWSQGMSEAGPIHTTLQKSWTVLKPIRQYKETAPFQLLTGETRQL